MASRLRDQPGTRSPRPRLREDLPGEGYLFPGEVAEMLGCRDIDYHQLRRLFRLVRLQAAQPVQPRKWARYTLKDVAALRVALDLCGGVPALEPGKHLRIRPVEYACEALRAQGVANPLLDVPLRREGDVVLAEINGLLFNPATGQLWLADSRGLIEKYLEEQLQHLDDEAERLKHETRQHRKVKDSLRREAMRKTRRKDAINAPGELRLSALTPVVPGT